MKSRIIDFWADEHGATAMEYALVAALIALAIVAGALALGEGIDNALNQVATDFGNAAL
ncbi:MAG: Flp family type IVb pilin [Maricaulaceae bacterium]